MYAHEENETSPEGRLVVWRLAPGQEAEGLASGLVSGLISGLVSGLVTGGLTVGAADPPLLLHAPTSSAAPRMSIANRDFMGSSIENRGEVPP